MKVAIFVIISLFIFQGTATAYEMSLKEIKLIENGEELILKTRLNTVEDLLASNSIVLHTYDIINLDLEHNLADNDTVIIDRAFPVNIVTNDSQLAFRVPPGETVYGLINTFSNITDKEYIYNGDLEKELNKGDVVHLIHVSEEYITTEEKIDFETEIIYNDEVWYGEENIINNGEYGLKAISELVLFEDGEEVSRQLLEEKILKEPINEVKELGTKRKVSTSTGYFEYLNSFTMEATAYSAQQANLSNYTATGVPAVRGVVAVDPTVIPLGSRLYIPGYGHALAADTGGAIKGEKIDLCFDTIQESIQFGRRNIEVYVLR